MAAQSPSAYVEMEHTMHSKVGNVQFLRTRIPSLKPTYNKTPNPFTLLRTLNKQHWLFFLVAFVAWSWDAFDFFTVSLTVTQIAATFGKTNADITWGITLVLMLRSIGAIIFGLASDRFGRKWPFVVNNILFIVLELATGFCNDYPSFLACRALFGIAMGGLYGNVVATALEDCPPATRGIVSGMLQVGYSFGYLLATVFSRALVGTTPHSWRPLFWFGACPPVLIIIFRICLPENVAYIERERVRKSSLAAAGTFVAETRVAIKNHWLLFVYLVLLMAGVNFLAHGTQDLYPTLLINQYGFSANDVTITQAVANIGAMSGGITVGYLSQIFGRRFSIVAACVVAGGLIYPYSFTSSHAVTAAAFFLQFFVQGAFGVIPVHLMELSPGAFRTFCVGTAYQLGNLASSASATIEAVIGEQFPLAPTATGIKRYDYGTVICIFTACSLVYVIILTIAGPEKKGAAMDVEHDPDVAEALGLDDVGKVAHVAHDEYRHEREQV